MKMIVFKCNELYDIQQSTNKNMAASNSSTESEEGSSIFSDESDTELDNANSMYGNEPEYPLLNLLRWEICLSQRKATIMTTMN